ncbi:17116_t:CDS:10 [Entrophospora sp. SA101]|nr:17116_t:CDS:10 [Entrophospora sp. SA101]
MIDDDDAINEITIATDGIKNITKIQLPLNAVEIMADLSFETLKSWNLPKFHLQILTQSRPNSFSRLLESLDSSIYFGDEIPLTINMNSSGWFVAKAYYPYSNHDHTVLLEDDIEIITLLLYLVKYIALKYIYGPDKKFYPEQVFDNTRYDVRSPYLCQDDNNNYKVQSIRIPYSRFNNWKNSWKHIAEYDDTYIHFREGKHDPLSILMVPLMAENVIFKELPGGALADYNDLPKPIITTTTTTKRPVNVSRTRTRPTDVSKSKPRPTNRPEPRETRTANTANSWKSHKFIRQNLKQSMLENHNELIYGTKNGEWQIDLRLRPVIRHKQEPLFGECDINNHYLQQVQYSSLETDKALVKEYFENLKACKILSGQRISIFGDSTNFQFHDMLIDYFHDGLVQCYGELFCKYHSLSKEEDSDDSEKPEFGASLLRFIRNDHLTVSHSLFESGDIDLNVITIGWKPFIGQYNLMILNTGHYYQDDVYWWSRLFEMVYTWSS